jgi:hypothetical protein
MTIVSCAAVVRTESEAQTFEFIRQGILKATLILFVHNFINMKSLPTTCVLMAALVGSAALVSAGKWGSHHQNHQTMPLPIEGSADLITTQKIRSGSTLEFTSP